MKTHLRDNLETILLALLARDGTLYGLELARAIEEVSKGALKLSVGSLYPALHKLVAKGCLLAERKTPPQGGAPVVYYTTTREGLTVLNSRRDKIKTFYELLLRLLEASPKVETCSKGVAHVARYENP